MSLQGGTEVITPDGHQAESFLWELGWVHV